MGHEVRLYPYVNGAKRKCVVDGKVYHSASDMYLSIGISEGTVRQCEKEYGISKEEAVAFLLGKKDEKAERDKVRDKQMLERKMMQKKRDEEKAFDFRGRKFHSFASCIRYYNNKFGNAYLLNAASVKTSARRRGEDVHETLERTLRRKLLQGIREGLPSYQKYQAIFLNSREKAERCALLLGNRCLDCWESPSGKYMIEYEPVREQRILYDRMDEPEPDEPELS